MESRRLHEIVNGLNRMDRILFYLRLCVELTVRAREAYSYQPETAKHRLKGMNELQHSIIGHIRGQVSESPTTPEGTFAERLPGFAEKLGVARDLSVALDSLDANRPLDVRD
jgi:hypothetical protein